MCGILAGLQRASTADAETGSTGPNIAITPPDISSQAENIYILTTEYIRFEELERFETLELRKTWFRRNYTRRDLWAYHELRTVYVKYIR